MESLYLTARTSADPAAERTRGTAWLLWPDVVVTALHVAGSVGGPGSWAHEKWWRKKPEEAGDAYTLRLPGGESVAVSPLVYDPAFDVALLALPSGAKVAQEAFGVLALPSGAKVAQEAFGVLAPELPSAGEPWRAVGYPAFETPPRAVALGGAVSFVGADVANNAIQLRVDQGTSVAWGGISGCAAQNTWGEVIGVVLQTVAGIATCNAAPAEAVARLLRLRWQTKAIEDAVAARLHDLGSAAVASVVSELWPALPATEGFAADPRLALARRIAQSGEGGMRLALAAIREAAAESGVVVPDAMADPILGRFATLVLKRPNEADLTSVLRALVDEGGVVTETGALAARLPEMPLAVLDAAIDALHERRLAKVTSGDASRSAELLAEGARRVVRKDYLRALLRELRDAGELPDADLAVRASMGPSAVGAALVCAEILGAVARNAGAHRITKVGEAWLAMRPGDAEPR